MDSVAPEKEFKSCEGSVSEILLFFLELNSGLG